MRETATLRSLHDLPPHTVRLTLVGLFLGLLLAALDNTVVGTAMPRVVADLGGFERYALVATAYMVTGTVVGPIVGRLSDLYGRKKYYLGGIGLFLVGSALCGASQSMDWLILARAFQGIGAGVMQTMAFTVVGDLFPPAQRGRAQGATAGAFGLSSLVGPMVGGYITDHWSWRWVFYINLPLGLLALVALALFFPPLRPHRPHRGIDYAGAGVFILAVGPLLLALSWGGTVYPWLSAPVLGLLVLAVLAALLFIQIERRAPEPLLPLGLFRHRIIGNALLVMALTAGGFFGTALFVPLFLQGVLGASATESGQIMTPTMLAFVGGSLLAGQTITRTGRYKLQAVGGLALAVSGMLAFATLGPETPRWLVVADLVWTGLGMGMTMPTFTIIVQNALPYEYLGVGTATAQFARALGGTVGSALFGTLVANRFQPAFLAALPPALQASLPADRLARLSNPRALFLGGEGGVALGSALAPFGQIPAEAAAQVHQALRAGLAGALHDAFFLGGLVMALALVAVLFIPEVPLRRSHHTAPLSVSVAPARSERGG